jgi:hypothetical protein
MVSLAVRRVDPRPPPTWPQTPPAGPEICGPRVYLEPVPVSPATTRTPHPRARSSDRLQHVTPPAATSRHESAASIARATAHVPAHVGAFGFPRMSGRSASRAWRARSACSGAFAPEYRRSRRGGDRRTMLRQAPTNACPAARNTAPHPQLAIEAGWLVAASHCPPRCAWAQEAVPAGCSPIANDTRWSAAQHRDQEQIAETGTRRRILQRPALLAGRSQIPTTVALGRG